MQLVRRFLLGILLLFFLSSLTSNFFEYRKNIGFYQSFKQEYEREKKKNTELKTRILKNGDPNQIEHTIRDKLNLLRPNEVAVILPSPSPTPAVLVPTQAPPYRQWVDVFFGDKSI